MLTTAAFHIVATTHVGCVQPKNEDRFLIKTLKNNSVLCAVADGLGGELKGDFASEIVRKELADIKEIRINAGAPSLARITQHIDATICNEAAKEPALNGMGSTIVGVLLQPSTAHWVHAGDSRLYLFRDQKLIQITQDQTLARFLLKEGEITADQFNLHYSRHVMDQYLGCGFCEPETGCLSLQPEDLMIISSDGLHKYVSNHAIYSLLSAPAIDMESMMHSFVHGALDAGGQDNITVIGIKVLSG